MRQPGVRQSEWPEALCERVVAGTQFDNMRRMARARRRGGRPTIRGLGREARRARSVALREAVQGGVWDADAVANALLGVEPRFVLKRTRGARLVRGRRAGFVLVAGESED